MERCNARTMEIYRRMGLAEQIRAAGLPARRADGRVHRLSLIEPPLCTCPIRRWPRRRRTSRATNDGTLPLEPYQLISQYTLEPLLKVGGEALPP